MRKLLNILKNYKGVIFDTDVLLKLAKQTDKNGAPSLDKFLDLMKKEKISIPYWNVFYVGGNQFCSKNS